MNKIGFAGTLDPLTNGHVWVIEEGRRMADHVEIYLSEAPGKKVMVPIQQRKELIEKFITSKGWDNVTVHIALGKFTARFAKNRGVEYLIRGIRNSVDFEYEDLIQDVNANMLHGCKTVFVIPPTSSGALGVNLGAVSSSFVKGLIGNVGWHWEVKKLIPETHYNQIVMDFLRKEWEASWPEDMREDKDNDSRYEYWFSQVIWAYSDANRFYHNLDHLVHGLTEINTWALNTNARADDVAVLKQAFWFHDIVMEKQHQWSAESRSATKFTDSYLTTFEYSGEVRQLILATDHFEEQKIRHHNKEVMIGVDLAILGQHPDVYQEYTGNIRKEYSQYSDADYYNGRMAALQKLSERAEHNDLFRDPYFAAEYNENAKANLAAELASVQKKLDSFAI